MWNICRAQCPSYHKDLFGSGPSHAHHHSFGSKKKSYPGKPVTTLSASYWLNSSSTLSLLTAESSSASLSSSSSSSSSATTTTTESAPDSPIQSYRHQVALPFSAPKLTPNNSSSSITSTTVPIGSYPTLIVPNDNFDRVNNNHPNHHNKSGSTTSLTNNNRRTGTPTKQNSSTVFTSSVAPPTSRFHSDCIHNSNVTTTTTTNNNDNKSGPFIIDEQPSRSILNDVPNTTTINTSNVSNSAAIQWPEPNRESYPNKKLPCVRFARSASSSSSSSTSVLPSSPPISLCSLQVYPPTLLVVDDLPAPKMDTESTHSSVSSDVNRISHLSEYKRQFTWNKPMMAQPPVRAELASISQYQDSFGNGHIDSRLMTDSAKSLPGPSVSIDYQQHHSHQHSQPQHSDHHHHHYSHSDVNIAAGLSSAAADISNKGFHISRGTNQQNDRHHIDSNVTIGAGLSSATADISNNDFHISRGTNQQNDRHPHHIDSDFKIGAGLSSATADISSNDFHIPRVTKPQNERHHIDSNVNIGAGLSSAPADISNNEFYISRGTNQHYNDRHPHHIDSDFKIGAGLNSATADISSNDFHIPRVTSQHYDFEHGGGAAAGPLVPVPIRTRSSPSSRPLSRSSSAASSLPGASSSRHRGGGGGALFDYQPPTRRSPSPVVVVDRVKQSEYHSQFKPFDDYIYIEGDGFKKKTSSSASSTSSSGAKPKAWFSEVKERNRQACQYRARSQNGDTPINPSHPWNGVTVKDRNLQALSLATRLIVDEKRVERKLRSASVKPTSKSAGTRNLSSAPSSLRNEPQPKPVQRPIRGQRTSASSVGSSSNKSDNLSTNKSSPIDRNNNPTTTTTAVNKGKAASDSGHKVWIKPNKAKAASPGSAKSAPVVPKPAPVVAHKPPPVPKFESEPKSCPLSITEVKSPEQISGIKSPSPESWKVSIEKGGLNWVNGNTPVNFDGKCPPVNQDTVLKPVPINIAN